MEKDNIDELKKVYADHSYHNFLLASSQWNPRSLLPLSFGDDLLDDFGYNYIDTCVLDICVDKNSLRCAKFLLEVGNY